MIAYPVYQMALAESLDSTVGLAFSMETNLVAVTVFPQPIFLVPETAYETLTDCYLPGEIKGERVDFVLKWENGAKLVISDPRLNYRVRFIIYFRYWDNYRGSEFTYLGEETKLVAPFKTFIPLIPIDLLIMDRLFIDQKACFVGLTPVYGERTDNLVNYF